MAKARAINIYKIINLLFLRVITDIEHNSPNENVKNMDTNHLNTTSLYR